MNIQQILGDARERDDERDQRRLDLLDAYERNGVGTWDDAREAHQIRRRQVRRAFAAGRLQ